MNKPTGDHIDFSLSSREQQQEALIFWYQHLVDTVRIGLQTLNLRLRGNLESIQSEREELRRFLVDIEKLIQAVYQSSKNTTASKEPHSGRSGSNVLLEIWSQCSTELDALYQHIHTKYAGKIREYLAHLQNRDEEDKNKYNAKIRYLDTIIGAKKPSHSPREMPLVHFLVDLYYLCMDDENGSSSVLEGIQEYVAILGMLPGCDADMNAVDEKGRTPLMRIMENQGQVDITYKSDHSFGDSMQSKREYFQKKISELRKILEDGRTEIAWTREQRILARELLVPEDTEEVESPPEAPTIVRVIHGTTLRIVDVHA